MKPGLRKVAALILVSVTLFGSGASVVSAAYADDTTMGTSTRIQAEPDVKTTTGGDEAAPKPDTGSGDEAGTGADEQSGTGAPAQSAPQADAGQAAPDVTVHDMLDTDSAAVSRLRLTDRITGTAPFDKDGDIRFKPLTYGRDNNGIDDCGEHRYVIRERNTGEKNVTYDRTEHHVTVTVGDDLQGNLTAKVEYDPTDGKTDKTKGDAVGDKPSTIPGMVTTTGTRPEFTNSYIPPATPAIVKTIRQLAKTGVSAPIVALAAFALLGVGLMLFRRRGNQTETARHRK